MYGQATKPNVSVTKNKLVTLINEITILELKAQDDF